MRKLKKSAKKNLLIFATCVLIIAVFVVIQMSLFKFDNKAENMAVNKQQQEINQASKGDNTNYFAISMNKSLVFNDGKSESDFNIKSDALNDFILVVEIVNMKNSKVIYRSDGIKPGQIIIKDRLDTVLKKGKYMCQVNYQAIDKKTLKLVGTTQEQIEIMIAR